MLTKCLQKVASLCLFTLLGKEINFTNPNVSNVCICKILEGQPLNQGSGYNKLPYPKNNFNARGMEIGSGVQVVQSSKVTGFFELYLFQTLSSIKSFIDVHTDGTKRFTWESMWQLVVLLILKETGIGIIDCVDMIVLEAIIH